MCATHVLRRTRWPACLDHARGKGLLSLCGRTRGYTVSTRDMPTSTAPVLPATTPNYLLSATLAEAATQLSSVSFLERCIFVNASPPPQLPVPTPSLDAATQTFAHIAAFRDASTQLSFREFLAPPSTLDVRCPACVRSVPSLHLDAAVQTPLHSVATHDASSQLPLTELFIGCILSNDPLDHRALPLAHCNDGNVSRPLNLLTLLRFAVPAAPATPARVTRTPRPHMSYQSHHRVSRSMPVFMFHMVYLLKRRRCDLVCVHLSQSRPTATCQHHPNGITSCALSSNLHEKRRHCPGGKPTILSIQILVQGLVLFLNREPLSFPWSILVNPNLTGSVTLTQLSAVMSCIINTVSQFFS